MEDKNNGHYIYGSFRIPNGAVWLAIASAATAFVGLGAATIQSTTNATARSALEAGIRAESAAVDAVRIATNAAGLSAQNSRHIDDLRISILQGSSNRYTKTETDDTIRKHDRTHDSISAVDQAQDRQIDNLQDELDDIMETIEK
jgi:hypothetical protein